MTDAWPPRWYEEACQRPSAETEAKARARQQQLTKPQGALGSLEEVAIRLAALQNRERPKADRAPIILFAADHGITAQGVSAFPSAVTVEMVKNFARGGAAISVLAREQKQSLTVVDVGTLANTPIDGVVTDKPRLGTADFSRGPAMTESDLDHALRAGGRETKARIEGADVVIFGEMGIGNTTAATAIAAAILARPAQELAGAGTGLDGEAISKKAAVITAALHYHGLGKAPCDARTALLSVGGLEIAALAGGMIAAAQSGVPVLVDGFIVTAAALAAVRLNTACRPWLLFSHASAEKGHRTVLEALDAKPLVDLGLRLGEGSGAAVVLPLVQLACALHNGMATFAEAAVSGRED